ncbi:MULTISPECIES: thymidine kinase [Thalassospira]|jgi:thymidine kinase|uniref:Thymidine kinase n=3 Tax=Thalassospira TaxID=168934 RepID=A0A367X464_9PROT|nr:MULTISPECIES: thymidine kinase [Thalassospira]MBR9779895.1 thymidine kinase [Rhodospirillales bacterium]AJD51923.1 thymidine kinase [Thalassospira xiamenensis M-5 = DSM 17429]KZB54447.1 thymidine kinase [Thalassospira xiamenensis]KZB68205.1 thymidine kinase [Thalassospira lucentensis]KZC97228.1 thymidine kinase [Thalassospira xiamenensis]|tara:strand:+ start:774 stop:1352 length:579 start_codon:yes stop_codon:yes gene_type:complete
MAKLFFYYSSMNAGKSTTLLQSSFNYQERGMQTLLLTVAFDDRFGVGKIASRIGLEAPAVLFDGNTDLCALIGEKLDEGRIDCVLVDEAQFLTKDQVWQLSDVADKLGVPVLCYGIRTDFQGQLFEGSKWLLAWADKLSELKTICHCGRKAGMVLRVDENGNTVREGAQVEIGGNDRYVSVCRQHFKEAMGK